jgi:HEAT repeat protein
MEAVPVYIEALKDVHGPNRAQAAEVFGAIGVNAKEAIPSLIIALQDWSANRAAAVALSRIGGDATSAVPALKEMSTVPDQSAAAWAVYALTKIDPENYPIKDRIPALIDALHRSSYSSFINKKVAAVQLGEMGKAAVPALIKAFQDKKNRLHIARSLGEIRLHIAPALGNIARALGDIARALGDIGRDAEPAIPVLTEALKDQHSFVQTNAAYALGTIISELRAANSLNPSSPEVKAAVSALNEMLKNERLANAAYVRKCLGSLAD